MRGSSHPCHMLCCFNRTAPIFPYLFFLIFLRMNTSVEMFIIWVYRHRENYLFIYRYMILIYASFIWFSGRSRSFMVEMSNFLYNMDVAVHAPDISQCSNLFC